MQISLAGHAMTRNRSRLSCFMRKFHWPLRSRRLSQHVWSSCFQNSSSSQDTHKASNSSLGISSGLSSDVSCSSLFAGAMLRETLPQGCSGLRLREDVAAWVKVFPGFSLFAVSNASAGTAGPLRRLMPVCTKLTVSRQIANLNPNQDSISTSATVQ